MHRRVQLQVCKKHKNVIRLSRMLIYFNDSVYDIFHILITHSMKHRQTYQLLIGTFSHRVFAAPITKPLSIVWMRMDRDVVDVYTQPRRPQGREDFRPAGPQLCQFKPDGVKVPCRIYISPHCRCD